MPATFAALNRHLTGDSVQPSKIDRGTVKLANLGLLDLLLHGLMECIDILILYRVLAKRWVAGCDYVR